MAKTNIIISDAAQRYIDDRINADHIATRAIALSITTFCGVPHVYTGNITEKRIFIKRGENVDEAIAKAFSIEDEQDTTEEQEEIMKTTTTTTDNTTNEEQEDIMRNKPITATKPIATTADGKEVYLDDYADCVIAGNSRRGKAVVDLCLSVKYQPAFRTTFDGVVYIVPGGEYLISCADAPAEGDFKITVPAGHNIAATIRKSIKRLYTDDVERAICERFERSCR